MKQPTNDVTSDDNYSNVQAPDSTMSTSNEKKISCRTSALNRMMIRVNKPLVPLKLSLFLWYGAGSVIQAYQMLFFRQRGLTDAHVSFINTVTPLLQCFGPTISGVIADKIGKSKPVLFANLILVLVFLNSMMLIPYITIQKGEINGTLVECHSNTTGNDTTTIPEFAAANCTFQCPSNTAFSELWRSCSGSNDSLCVAFSRFLIGSHTLNIRHVDKGDLLKDVIILHDDNTTSTWCDFAVPQNCNLTCYLGGSPDVDNSTYVFLLSMILLILFNTTFSNCYRFMDVTAMSMVKTHNSDFGRERLWCVISTIILTPLSGCLVELSTLEDGTKNYSVAFYMFDILILLDMITVWKLDVKITPPGDMMWKKTLHLLKNPDVVFFFISVLILGSSWGFVKVFSTLFLDDLGAPSMIAALLPTVSAVVGLPFLFTSNWWLEKIGSNNLLLIGFFGYTIKCLGYSFLIDPWLALLCEMLAILTYHLLWVAVVRHSHEVAPHGLTATVIATAGGIHYGLGRGTGSLIGGLVKTKYGGRWAFRVIALIAFVAGILYAIFLYFRKKYKKGHEQKKSINAGVELNGDHLAENSVGIGITSTPPSTKVAIA